jgi:hypothetical protein
MKTRRISRLRRAFEIARKFLTDCRARSACEVAPSPSAQLMPGPGQHPQYKDCPLTPPKAILGCDPRLLTKLLS